MRLRNQHPEPAALAVATADQGQPNHAELRERGAALLAAADDAISRALSRNSAEFLEQNRQAGGE